MRKSVASITSSLTRMSEDLLAFAEIETGRGLALAVQADVAQFEGRAAIEEAAKATKIATKIKALVA
jgi:hypothetical protein